MVNAVLLESTSPAAVSPSMLESGLGLLAKFATSALTAANMKKKKRKLEEGVFVEKEADDARQGPLNKRGTPLHDSSKLFWWCMVVTWCDVERKHGGWAGKRSCLPTTHHDVILAFLSSIFRLLSNVASVFTALKYVNKGCQKDN